jgi:hypothetical protein
MEGKTIGGICFRVIYFYIFSEDVGQGVMIAETRIGSKLFGMEVVPEVTSL